MEWTITLNIEDENIFTYLELPSRMLLYMNGKPAMGKFHLFIECIFYASVNIKKYVTIVNEMDAKYSCMEWTITLNI
jgi:hypothetical protein